MSGGSAVSGERNGRARLTEREVLDIRGEFTTEGVTITSLAKYYRVSEGAIRQIVSRKTWKHI